ncbi:MAG: sulfur transferase domain-containing protein [Gammaproteobacteria bacterium]|nr:sulfur transferase domain-containing protein [Gammaproteobacteria bacterium]
MTDIKLNWSNLSEPLDGVFTAGQPDEAQIANAAEQGVKSIVNLCAEGEAGFDEGAEVEDRGMRYFHIPVCGPQDVCEDKARELDKLLEDESLRPMIVHCGSANRVGALFALREFHCKDAGADAAIAAGKEAGLAGLESRVRECLS